MPAEKTAQPMTSLAERLPSMPEDRILLLNVTITDANRVFADIVRSLLVQGFHGVYVSLSRDYMTVSSELEAAAIDVTRLRYVDATSRMFGIAPIEVPEVVYVDGPLSLDGLAEGIAQSLRALPAEKRFLLLDSLTTIQLYNSPESTVAFGRTLKKLLKKEGAAGVIAITYQDDLNEELLSKLVGSDAEAVLA